MAEKLPKKDFILASGSPQRRALLAQIGYEPQKIEPADINEQTYPNEKPLTYIRRIAKAKALAVAKNNPHQNILSADTIIVCSQKIIQKSADAKAETEVIKMLSGKSHRVITSVCLINKQGHLSQKTVTTKIYMKHLTPKEIDDYIKSNEWCGVAGYKIEGMLAGFVKKIIGSYSGVVGLPLYETKNLLNSAGTY